MKTKKPVVLCILDGYGINDCNKGNAAAAAKTPVLDKLLATCPHSVIKCSGLDVGLPKGQMGNSEVGHTNIGAGRVVYQELTGISKEIEDGTFYVNEEFSAAAENCKKYDSALHLMGLLSDGGVHSHNEHLYALLEFARRSGLKKVYIHCFLDGRDVAPDSGKKFLEELERKTAEIGIGKISTVMGRFYAMDRDNRWERVSEAYDAMVSGKGISANSASRAIEQSYREGVYDEFVKPVVIGDGGQTASVKANDSIIFFNFRPDRAREITRAFADPDFKGFEREKGFFNTYYVCFTQYDALMPNVKVAFKPKTLTNTFGEYISKHGCRQLRIAETEKYAHVTFFFNGGVERKYENEDRALIPSPQVSTYDLKPEMSAYEVAEEAVKRIESGVYDAIILNFANCDMVGHTGIFTAAVKAVEAVDECVGKVCEAVEKESGVMLITADHGNSEQMIDYDTDGPFTQHTVNAVPLIGTGIDRPLKDGRLADLAPTMLELLNLEKPIEMTGESLLL